MIIDLPKFLSAKYNLSVRQAKKMLKDGYVYYKDFPYFHKKIDEKDVDNIYINKTMHELTYNLEQYVIQKDKNVIFLYKPPFMHTERLTPFDQLTIDDIVKTHYPEYSLISRLDFETDGIIAAVKKNVTFQTTKQYLAFVAGEMTTPIEISNKIDAENRKKVKVINKQTDHKTYITPLQTNTYKGTPVTLIEIKLVKATRHQIRAYCSYLGYPIIGDDIYGNYPYKRLMLHCKTNHIFFPQQKEIICHSPNWENFISSFK